MSREYIYNRHLVVVVAGTVDHVTNTCMVRRPNEPQATRVPLEDIVIRELVR